MSKLRFDSPPGSGSTVVVDEAYAARIFHQLAVVTDGRKMSETFSALALVCAMFCDQAEKAGGKDLRTWLRDVIRDAPVEHFFRLTPAQLRAVVGDDTANINLAPETPAND